MKDMSRLLIALTLIALFGSSLNPAQAGTKQRIWVHEKTQGMARRSFSEPPAFRRAGRDPALGSSVVLTFAGGAVGGTVERAMRSEGMPAAREKAVLIAC